MSVTLRLARVGAKKQPKYRIVADTTRNKNRGKALEVVGTYLPLELEDKQVTVDKQRYDHWLKVGAIPSQTVASIVKRVS